MEIKYKNDNEGGLFFVEINDDIVAKMVYTWQGHDRTVIEHTEVDSSLGGKGIGK